jgi:hypothetical protein
MTFTFTPKTPQVQRKRQRKEQKAADSAARIRAEQIMTWCQECDCPNWMFRPVDVPGYGNFGKQTQDSAIELLIAQGLIRLKQSRPQNRYELVPGADPETLTDRPACWRGLRSYQVAPSLLEDATADDLATLLAERKPVREYGPVRRVDGMVGLV